MLFIFVALLTTHMIKIFLISQIILHHCQTSPRSLLAGRDSWGTLRQDWFILLVVSNTTEHHATNVTNTCDVLPYAGEYCAQNCPQQPLVGWNAGEEGIVTHAYHYSGEDSKQSWRESGKVIPWKHGFLRACLYGAELLGKPSYSPCRVKKPICLYETELPGAKCLHVITGQRRVTRLAEISVEFAEISPRRVTRLAM